jgi:transcriptional regulator with XRE-family HTH domain
MVRQRTRQFESVGARIARMRRQRGVTQVELARRVGLAQPNISDYERGAYFPNAAMIIQIARALGASGDELLGLTPAPRDGRPLSRRVRRRFERVEALPAAQQRALLKTIDAYIEGVQRRLNDGNGRA